MPRGFGPGHPGRPGGPNGPQSPHDGPNQHGPDGHQPHQNDPHSPDRDPNQPDPTPDRDPLPPDQVNGRHADQTPAGTSYHRGDPEMGDLPHRVQPDPDGRYTVDVHVTPEGNARIGGRDYTPEEFAEVLRRNGDYDGRPVRLIGCDAGSNDFAQRLSRELDTPVLAPDRPAWTDSNGRVFSSDYDIGPDGRVQPRIPPNGDWSVHNPDGSTTRTGDAFTPGTPDAGRHDVDVDSAQARGRDFPSPHEIRDGWREPGYDHHRPMTLQPGERFFDPDNPRSLDPRTRYDVTDSTGRRSTIYTDNSQPPRITHVDADVPNTRVGADPHNTRQNPDTDHLLPDVDYRVHTGEGRFEFGTGHDGRPVLDVDDFDPPTNATRQPDVNGWDPSRTGNGPFSTNHPTPLQPNSRYDVYSTDASGNRQWHGTFYTNGENPPGFSHIATRPDDLGNRWVNPETGDIHTMRDPLAGRPDGLPLPGCKYQIGDMVYHTDAHGNSAVSFEPDYGTTGRPRGDGRAVVRTGEIGEQNTSQTSRGGHTADHASGAGAGRLAVAPQLYTQNNPRGAAYDDNWAYSEIDRRNFEGRGGDHGQVRTWLDAPSVGETPDRWHTMSERVSPSGVSTYNYRSFVNVPNPPPVAPATPLRPIPPTATRQP